MGRGSAVKKIETVTARLAALKSQRDAAVAAAVDAGCTWAEIAKALGVSAQAAHKRFRWIRHSPLTGEVWHEPPLELN
jgi:hypothetical protein